MKCSCPKCKTEINEDLPSIPDDGAFLSCASCSANFNVKKESFARRSLHRGSSITCAECGSEVGPAIYCQDCHALYPDYYVTETASAAKKQLGKILAKFKVLNRLGKTGKAKTHPKEPIPTATTKQKAKGVKIPVQSAQFKGALAILLVIICSAGFYYYQQKIESEYTGKFVKALFAIKSSEDYNIILCDKIAADWRARQSATAPGIATAERTFLSRGLKDAETVMKSVPKPPKKYSASSDALTQLFEIYKKHQKLTTSPAGSLETFTASAKSLDNDFRKSSIALKASLPEKLTDKLADAKKKHKELQNF